MTSGCFRITTKQKVRIRWLRKGERAFGAQAGLGRRRGIGKKGHVTSSGCNGASARCGGGDNAGRYLAGGGFGAGIGMFGASGKATALPLMRCFGFRRRQKRVLILMSATGGGHRASAIALKDAFFERFGTHYKVDIVDPITDHSPWPISALPPSYNWMVKHPWVWWLNFKMSSPRIMHVPFFWAVAAFCVNTVNEMYEHFKPDLIVSVHPLLQHAPLRLLAARVKAGYMKPTPFATVITDFATCHTTWFHKEVVKCFVPTQNIWNLAKRMGLKDSQLIMRGLPIRPAFSHAPRSKGTLRRELGLQGRLPCVLMVGGGEGMGPVERTAAALAKALDGAGQVVVICGRNEKLANRLKATDFGRTPVHVCGFINNMFEYMSASDCIITKAGPGTIAEALICGLPMILNDYIPCQEASNVPYVLEHGAGIYTKDPQAVSSTVARWFSPNGKAELAAMSKKAKEMGRPNATFRIVEDLAALID